MRRTLIVAAGLTCGLTIWCWDDLVGSISGGCGLFHRDTVRSATDAAAGTISFVPQGTTIAALITAAPASGWPWAGRIAPVETTVWRLRARVTAITGPLDDGDYHLRLVDDAGHRMIAESVAPKCATGSPFLPQISQVRAKVSAAIPLNTPLNFTGIGFLDNDHDIIGAAANGVELHPLLGISE